MKILIVDDDEDDIMLLKDTIRDIDDRIVVLYEDNVSRFIIPLAEKNPDLIFLDINTHLNRGKECLYKIRHHKTYKKIPIIIYSTRRCPEEFGCINNEGFTFLEKQCNMLEFNNRLKIILSNYRMISG